MGGSDSTVHRGVFGFKLFGILVQPSFAIQLAYWASVPAIIFSSPDDMWIKISTARRARKSIVVSNERKYSERRCGCTARSAEERRP